MITYPSLSSSSKKSASVVDPKIDNESVYKSLRLGNISINSRVGSSNRICPVNLTCSSTILVSIRALVSNNNINLSNMLNGLSKSGSAPALILTTSVLTFAYILCHVFYPRNTLQRVMMDTGSTPLPAKYIDDGSDFKRQADQLNLGMMAPFSPLLKHLTSISTPLNGIWFFRSITHNTEGPLHTAFRSSFKNVFSPKLLEVYNRDGKTIVQQHIAELVQQLKNGQTLDLKATSVDLFRKLTCLWFVSSLDGASGKNDIESALFNRLFASNELRSEPSQDHHSNLTATQKATVEKLATELLALPEISIEAAQIKNSLGGGALLDLFHGFSIESLAGLVAGFINAPIGFGALWRALNTVEGQEKLQNLGFRLALLSNFLGFKTEIQSAALPGFASLKQLTDTLRLADKHLPNSLIGKLNQSLKENMPQLPTLFGNTFAPSADEITLYTSVLMVAASTFLTPVALTEFLMSAYQNPDLQREISEWRQLNPTDKASIQTMTKMDLLLDDHIPFNALSRIDETGDPILVHLTRNPSTDNTSHGFAQGGAHECMGRPLVGAMFADIMQELFTQASRTSLILHFTPNEESLYPISLHDEREPAIFQWREMLLSATKL
jgi:hypothetical protein